VRFDIKASGALITLVRWVDCPARVASEFYHLVAVTGFRRIAQQAYASSRCGTALVNVPEGMVVLEEIDAACCRGLC
jgi:hypothetical protein